MVAILSAMVGNASSENSALYACRRIIACAMPGGWQQYSKQENHINSMLEIHVRIRSILLGLSLTLLPLLSAHALEKPRGEVLLTVSGTLGVTNDGEKAVFDRAMLEKLPQYKYTVVVPWFSGPQVFEGPLLADVLAAAKAKGSQLTFKALNDYMIGMPLEDAKANAAILAMKHNGEVMTPRNKGPLFVMFPFERAELRKSEFYQRCVWQLASIDVK
ncbi:molybdopterin-dependent oxidoreductase [Chitinilyticum piscinae]|uniref:Molybdopterin-dependent oxidoreductase n=1 Tax=Chitinilyticum piscinae TaxID=2866724 RepID=A0A8J7K2M2_9NEIS|nr:molybdopterin-dependent oxidoreductase [Chitinilyticum piscinae]MBE9610222.1 molybdopterin-dependent oxidoreductase [Chitinilyticum piscinae]